jgi:diguanylate cyclase (GGDEF)-like protein
MEMAAERRVAPEAGLAQKLAWPLRLPRAQGWRLVLLGTWLTGLADLVTGLDVWFGPIYLIVIGLAAWSLGWREAVGTCVACFGITFLANDLQVYPYGGGANAWNIAVRVLAVAGLISLLHTVRTMYAREWRLSRTDPLTGALTRKAFFELTSSRTSSRGWSILLYADLDGFKALNDGLGHTAGDEYLADFVRQVAKSIRQDDVFARIGGDEFAIYLDVNDQAAAKSVAVRLHRAMNAAELAHGATVRCSVGALILQPGTRSIEQEVRLADILMYEAKGLGSSLVVGTAIDREGARSIHYHWELTPETSRVEQECARLGRLEARGGMDAAKLQRVA